MLSPALPAALLSEAPRLQTRECLSVAGLVTGHLVHGVTDGVRLQAPPVRLAGSVFCIETAILQAVGNG